MTAPKHLHSEHHRGLVPTDQLGNNPGTDGWVLQDNGDGTADWVPASFSNPPFMADIFGWAWKLPVRLAIAVPVTLASGVEAGDVIQGNTLDADDRILLAGQTDPAENGIWVVAASGAPTRAADADIWDELIAAAVAVGAGTYSQTSWACDATGTGVIDVDGNGWSQMRTNNDAPFPTTTASGADATLNLRPAALGKTAGENVELYANDATGSGTGGYINLGAGSDSADGKVGAFVQIGGASPTAHGLLYIQTDGSEGSPGDVLTSDGSGNATWAAPSPAADITDIPTSELDTTLVLAPDGAGGVEFRAEAGGSVSFVSIAKWGSD